MRKLFLILLLAILPLQYAWSAAAAYCGHEQEQSQHFGHHAHQHNAQAGSHDGDGNDSNDGGDGGGKGKLPGKAKIHADCAVCHHAVQASLLSGMAPPPDAACDGYPPSSDSLFSSHIADGPKKPDWRPAA
jgi:hypothetical protein